MTNEDIVRYWIKSSDHDFGVMERNFAAGDYVWALFIGHLVIEKLFKACCARKIGKKVARTHDLPLLAEAAGIATTAEQKEALELLTRFNALCRYPDWKDQFCQTASREYTARQISTIKDLREWLLQILSQPSNP